MQKKRKLIPGVGYAKPLTAKQNQQPGSKDTVAKQSDSAKPWLFQPGQSGNPAGRPKGARSKFSEDFLQAFARDFQQHGEAVIQKVRKDRPADYLKIASSLVPRQMEVENTGLTHEERLAERERRIAEYEAQRGSEAVN